MLQELHPWFLSKPYQWRHWRLLILLIESRLVDISTSLDRIDKLFDCFNSRPMSTWSSAPMRSAIMDQSDHIAFLRECLTWILTVKPQSGRKLPCLEGWVHDINSLFLLRDELRVKHGFTQLQPAQPRLSRKLLSVIRGKGGNRINPDSQQFQTAFQQILLEMLKDNTDEGKGNC